MKFELRINLRYVMATLYLVTFCFAVAGVFGAWR